MMNYFSKNLKDLLAKMLDKNPGSRLGSNGTEEVDLN